MPTANIALLINNASTIGRAIDVNNYGASTTIGGTNTSGTATYSSAINLYKDLTLTAASGGTVAITGALTNVSGTNDITKADLGTVTLSNTGNTYTGSTNISAGTLRLGASNVLPNGTAVTIGDNATLDANGYSETTASLSSNYATSRVLLGSPGAATTFTTGNSSNTTFAGVISGNANAGFTKTGTGNLTLTGANTLAGAVILNGSGNANTTLANTTGQALGSVSSITVNTGNVLVLGASNQINDSANLALAGGTFNVNGFSESMRQLTMSASSTIDYVNDGSVLRFNGVAGSVSGLGALTGTLTVADWAGSFSGNGSEQFVVYSTTGAPTVTGITFTGWGATTTIARADLGAGYYEILPTLTGIQWNVNASGNWATAGNWNPAAVPDGVDAIAIMGNVGGTLSVNPNVSLGNTNRTVGKLVFDTGGSTHGYTISSTGGRLDFSASTGTAQIVVSDNSSHTLATNGQFNSATTVTNNSSATTGLTLSGNLDQHTNGTLTFNGNGNTLVSGAITQGSGTTPVVKAGTGTLTFSGANTYTGTTTVSAGTLVAANNTALGANNVSTVTVASGATLGLQGGIAISKDTVGTPRLTLNGTGLSSAGALRNISGNNSWAGDITLGSATTIYSATAGNTLTLGNGSYTNTVTMGANTLTVDGGGNILFNSIVGAAGDSGAFVKNGTGTTTFTGNYNNYTGLTTVNQGTLVLDTSIAFSDQTIRGNLVIGDNLGAANSAVVQYGPPANSNKIADTSTVTINSDGLLDLNGNVDRIGALTFNGGHVTTGTGYLRLGADVTSNAAGNTATIDGIIHLDTTSRTFTVATGGDLTINARVDNGSIVKAGAGTMYLTHDNITGGGYTGTVTVSAGVLNISNGNALGTTVGGTTVSSGAALQLQGGISVGAEPLTVNGTGISSDGALRNISGNNSWAGSVTSTSLARINSDAGTLTLSGAITSTAELRVGGAGNTTFSGGTLSLTSLTKDGSGTLTISDAVSYSGATAISGTGTLQFGTGGTGGAISGSSAVSIASGATLNVQNGQSNNIGTLTANSGSTLTIGSGTLITTGGTIAGAFTGTGTLQTSGNLTITTTSPAFAGTLQVTGGILDLSSMGASFSIGTLTLGANTTLKLGNSAISIGTLNITGASTIDFSGTSRLNVGTLTIPDALPVGTLSIANWVNGVDYFYAQYWTGNSINTRGDSDEQQINFNPSNSSYTPPNTAWLPYQNDSDTTVRQVTPAPEPATYGAIFMGLSLFGLGLRRWRNRRKS